MLDNVRQTKTFDGVIDRFVGTWYLSGIESASDYKSEVLLVELVYSDHCCCAWVLTIRA